MRVLTYFLEEVKVIVTDLDKKCRQKVFWWFHAVKDDAIMFVRTQRFTQIVEARSKSKFDLYQRGYRSPSNYGGRVYFHLIFCSRKERTEHYV